MENNLTNFIKYCLGYIRLTRQRTIIAQKKYSVILPEESFGLIGLLNGEADGKISELINLPTFYSYDPNDLPDELKEKYAAEKMLANTIEDIYSKYKNDQFTKQIILNYGYYEIEMPEEVDEDVMDAEVGSENEEGERKVKIDKYPLFSIPVRIEKEIIKGVGKYHIYTLDPDVQINIGNLEPILGEDLFYQLVEQMGCYELEGKLTLPILSNDVFIEIWHKIKAQLKLKDAKFNENSFTLDEVHIALSPRSNYFLAEDLQNLSKMNEQELNSTSLASWISDEMLNEEASLPNEGDLYFPFLYDKYQLRVLKILSNKAGIVQGPPGTGKSETIANLLCHLAATGKRVLFVSQKAQALKVVKDKIKKLNIKYLFGYIPNPASPQIDETDEIDGVAPQLTGLGAHIEKMGYEVYGKGQRKSHSIMPGIEDPSLVPIVEEKYKNKEQFNSIIDSQRKYYSLCNELSKLTEYDFKISNITNYESEFNHETFNQMKEIISNINKLSQNIDQYSQTEAKKQYDGMFMQMKYNGYGYSGLINSILNDVRCTGYDRRSGLGRAVNNIFRNIRQGRNRSKLPREMIDYIDNILNSDKSRNQAVSELEQLFNYSSYRDWEHQKKASLKSLELVLDKCGLSEKEFNVIDDMLRKKGGDHFADIKNSILRIYSIKKEIDSINLVGNVNSISQNIKRFELTRRERIALYIQNLINKDVLGKWSEGTKVRQIIEKLARAFGKSKKAFKTFDNLRKDPDNFKVILELIPIWIMELDDASRIIPLEPGLFDYVILDEASQCNIAYTLPVMFRANKSLFVGDSEQMRDNTIMFKSNKSFDELAKRYQIPEELQIKATGSAVQSVLDISALRGFMSIPLRYYYRSPAELIGFSNKYFYKPKGKELIPLNNEYLSYKDTNRIMIIHAIQSDWADEISDKVNVAEANAIFNLFKDLRGDGRYKDKSIGILTFFNAQASYIRELFENNGFKEEENNYKVSIIEGIQGDEKEIILYSFVIRSQDQKNKYVPLTGEGGDIRADINKGRVNVAFSRSKLQVHCFVSMPIMEIPDNIWIKKYLEYVNKHGEVCISSRDLKPFDSYFEEEIYSFIKSKLGNEFIIQNQVPSCGFKIDFVATNTKTVKKIAIECDGPTHFRNELDEEYGIYIDSDEERQGVLEAAGWQFYRIKYSDWINQKYDRDVLIKDILELAS